MDDNKALDIVTALANGVNPLTGEALAQDSIYQAGDVIRALYVATQALRNRRHRRVRSAQVANAGTPWSEEEEQRLLEQFDAGVTLAEMASQHERTVAGVQARLERLGRLPAAGGRWPRAGQPSGR